MPLQTVQQSLMSPSLVVATLATIPHPSARSFNLSNNRESNSSSHLLREIWFGGLAFLKCVGLLGFVDISDKDATDQDKFVPCGSG